MMTRESCGMRKEFHTTSTFFSISGMLSLSHSMAWIAANDGGIALPWTMPGVATHWPSSLKISSGLSWTQRPFMWPVTAQ